MATFESPQESTPDFLHLRVTTPSEAEFSPNLPVGKLVALMEASNEMMQSSSRRNRKATLKTVVSSVHKLLEVEACAVYLVNEDNSKELILAAAYTDTWGEEFSPVRLQIQSVLKGGLTGHIADIGEIVRLSGAELKNNLYIAGKLRDFLASGECFSLLAVPLKDKKGHLLGVMKVDNKKSSEGAPGEAIAFSDVDESIARILANKVIMVLESLRMFEAFNNLMSSMNTIQNLDEILKIILQKGQALLYADRGDLALWDERQKDLVLRVKSDEAGSTRQLVQKRSVMYHVWEQEKLALYGDVSKAPYYYCANPNTKSEIAIRLDWEGHKIGVLNLESFQLNGFDQEDCELLEALSQYAATAIRMVGKEADFRNIVGQLGTILPPQAVLTSILESVRSIYDLGGGIIYIADDTSYVLRCLAYISEEPLDIKDPQEFSYKYDESSLATKIFREKKGYFAVTPADSNVNQKGIQAFRIRSSIVGVPLVFANKSVGVLVSWSNHSKNRPTERDITNLEPFARLAAANIAISEAEHQRKIVLDEIQHILTQMQTNMSLEAILQVVLHGVQVIGFDRIRIYKNAVSEQHFVLLASLGIKKTRAFQEHTIDKNRNLYAKDFMKTALSNPIARKYDETVLGPSPIAEAIQRPRDLPWAVVPLVITGELYGYISADNANTRREITTESLEYLTLLGALAAQAIANAQFIDMLRGRNLPILSGSLSPVYSKLTVVRMLLVYLTAEESLGFSRAVFLELNEISQHLMYITGLGSITSGRFALVTQVARKEGIQELLDHVDTLNDPEIEEAMRGFWLDIEEPTMEALLKDFTAQEFSSAPGFLWPEWAQHLEQRIDADHIIAIPVRVGEKIFGLFIVDRKWQTRMIGEADKAALETFVRLAAAHIAISESEHQRRTVLDEIQKIVTKMQTELSPTTILHEILRGVQVVGFDRVRIYRNSEDGQSFICLDSVEMGTSGTFQGTKIYPARNPYTRAFIKDIETNPVARSYDPLTTELGPDPDAESLKRPADLPFAMAPLVIAGRLYGYISADNLYSNREITSSSLEYMTLLSALAAQAIANAETIEMLRASRLKDEFLQRMAHIFGTSTAAVEILVQNLRDGIVDNERALKEYIPAIAKLNERFLGLAQNIVDFAALREDTKLNIVSVDLRSLVEDAMHNLRIPAEQRSIRFEANFPAQSCNWDLDSVRVLNAIEALLDNAVKFSPSGSKVWIRLQEDDHEAKLIIRDEGAGIADEELRFVFDSFYRGRNALQQYVDGTGLGLAIVDQTMKLHRGKVSVRTHPKGGAEFTLIFPKIGEDNRSHD